MKKRRCVLFNKKNGASPVGRLTTLLWFALSLSLSRAFLVAVLGAFCVPYHGYRRQPIVFSFRVSRDDKSDESYVARVWQHVIYYSASAHCMPSAAGRPAVNLFSVLLFCCCCRMLLRIFGSSDSDACHQCFVSGRLYSLFFFVFFVSCCISCTAIYVALVAFKKLFFSGINHRENKNTMRMIFRRFRFFLAFRCPCAREPRLVLFDFLRRQR